MARGQNQRSGDNDRGLVSFVNPKVSGADQRHGRDKKNKTVKTSVIAESPSKTADR